jgi:hypothetical protein
MTWTHTLDGEFAELSYRIDMRPSPEKTSVFEGKAFYQLTSSGSDTSPQEIRAFWADTNGSLNPIKATRDGNTLISYWGEPHTEEGRTAYELLSATERQITDWVKTPDGWRQFNQNRFVRAGAP